MLLCYCRTLPHFHLHAWWLFFSFSFLSEFSSQTLKINKTARKGRGTSFIPPFPPAHYHWDIYLQLCMWDYYYVFLIATLVLTKLLIDEIYHLIKLPFQWLIDDAMFVCLPDELILGFCYSDLILETGGFERALTITLVLQASQLTKFNSEWSHERWKGVAAAVANVVKDASCLKFSCVGET